MKNNLIRLATVAAMAAGMTFAQVPAQTPQEQPPAAHRTERGRKAEHQRMMQSLNLTSAQKQEAKTLFQEARASSKPVREQLRQNRQALADAIKADDTARIHTLSARQANLFAQMTEIRADAMAKFYTKLSPGQRAKADQLHQQMMQRWQQHRTQRQSGRTNG
jgi:Spy/CpxP family protein refolding chaperone